MTGPVKVDSSPYKVSNKKQFIAQSVLCKSDEKQKKRLTHAHNLLTKKRVNMSYFKFNKDVSPKEVFNVNPDDFVFGDKSVEKRRERREKFLKKYLKLQSVKKAKKLRLDTRQHGHLPDVSHHTTQN